MEIKMISTKQLLGFIVLGIAWYNMTSEPEIGKLVKTHTGSMEGTVSVSRDGREFYEWLGIPYAMPPVGDYRFQSPRPMEPWMGVLDAKAYGSSCAAITYIAAKIVGDEDCLYLNVHVPKLERFIGDNKDLLPVMVYIHGGAFVQGSGSEMRPEFFMDEDVVLVTFNYRIGILGFLSTGDDLIKGNMGLKDQVVALQWVNTNIQAFGGDPNKITILGDSSGAASVHYHLMSWQSKGMFQKAVMISGAAAAPWSYVPLERAVETARTIAQRLHCPTQDPFEMAECLKNFDVPTLLSAIAIDMEEFFLFKPHRKSKIIIGPTSEAFDDEDSFLTQHPLRLMQKGKFQKVPLLAGVMANEGLASAYPFIQDVDAMRDFEVNITENIGRVCLFSGESKFDQILAEKINNYYLYHRKKPIPEDERPRKYTEMFSDCFYNLQVSRAVEYQRLHSDSYLFYFNMDGGPSTVDLLVSLGSTIEYYKFITTTYLQSIFGGKKEDYGVNHGDALPFLFPLDSMPKIDPSLSNFSRKFVKFLVDFASTKKNTLRFGGLNIPPLSKSGPLTYLELNTKPKLKSAPFQSRLDFIKSLGII